MNMIREVCWNRRWRIGRWSFWLRGTDQRGPKLLQHHCRGTERCEPVDLDGLTRRWECRGCGAKASSHVLAVWKRRDLSSIFWRS